MNLNLELIKKKRLEKDFNTSEMAEFLGLANGSQYWKRENGDYKFKSHELPVLSQKLDIPFSLIFENDTNSKKEKCAAV